MGLFPKFWESYCPVCEPEQKGYIYDRGFKFWSRLAEGNNRFACRKCKATWRRKNQFQHTTLQFKDPRTPRAKTVSLQRKMYNGLLLEIKRNFWACCIIATLSAGFVYFVMHSLPHSILELAPKHSEAQNATSKNGEIQGLRNDKLSGKQELMIRRNGKKN